MIFIGLLITFGGIILAIIILSEIWNNGITGIERLEHRRPKWK